MDIELWQHTAFVAATEKMIDIARQMFKARQRVSMQNLQIFQEAVQRLCLIEQSLKEADYEG